MASPLKPALALWVRSMAGSLRYSNLIEDVSMVDPPRGSKAIFKAKDCALTSDGVRSLTPGPRVMARVLIMDALGSCASKGLTSANGSAIAPNETYRANRVMERLIMMKIRFGCGCVGIEFSGFIGWNLPPARRGPKKQGVYIEGQT